MVKLTNSLLVSRSIQFALALLVLTAPLVGTASLLAQAVNVSSTDNREPKIDFTTQIMPIFSRHGCNAAECHGSATGRGDFKLSLFGGDPARDYGAIVNELEGRRINYSSPQKSLLLTKPTEVLAHAGGEVFEPDSVPAKRILKWIQDGASNSSTVQIERILVNKNSILATKDNDEFQIKVTAVSSVGQNDVTADTVFTSSNPVGVEVSSTGKIRVKKPGKYFVTAKYLQFVVPITIVHPFESELPAIAERPHPLDRQVQQSLNKLCLPFPGSVSEHTFVRRIYLDMTGRLPTAQQTRAYLESKDPDKKTKLIDRLLKSPAFHKYWAFWLRRVIQFRTPGNDAAAAKSLNHWILQSVRDDQPWTEITRQLLTAKGDTAQVPPANFHRFFADARGEAETVANSFLGFRIGCANCHNHPLDQWTQEDYHGLAAIFATLKRGKTISELPTGTVIQPKTGRPAIARIPGELDLKPNSAYRQELANWMLQSDRFQFATVNRVWKHFMGRGIVEPVDDFRLSNPPLDQELLKLLAVQFEKNEFRFQALIRYIVSSELYASQPDNTKAAGFWAGYQSKIMSAEVLHDACRQVLYREPGPKIQSENSATENFELAVNDQSMRLLKGCDPRGDCIVGESQDQVFGLREKLHLINGKFLNRWIHDPKNQITQDLKELDRKDQSDLMKAISLYYQRSLARGMTKKETEYWQRQIELDSAILDTADGKVAFVQDAIWSLLNSQEFITIN